MTNYTFETMIQAQADAFTAGDVLVFSSAATSGRSVAVTLTAATSKLASANAAKSLSFNLSAFNNDSAINGRRKQAGHHLS